MSTCNHVIVDSPSNIKMSFVVAHFVSNKSTSFLYYVMYIHEYLQCTVHNNSWVILFFFRCRILNIAECTCKCNRIKTCNTLSCVTLYSNTYTFFLLMFWLYTLRVMLCNVGKVTYTYLICI